MIRSFPWPLAIVLLALATTALVARAASYPTNPQPVPGAVVFAKEGIARFESGMSAPTWQALDGRHTDAPVVAGAVVLVGSDRGLHALDLATGRALWTRALPSRAFSPAVAGGVAYAGSEDGTVVAVTVADGRERWRRRFRGWIYTPAVIGDVVVVGGSGGELRGLDAGNGVPRWTRDLPQELVHHPVTLDGDGVVVTTFSGHVLALSAADGGLRWQVRDPVASTSPTLSGGVLVFPGLDGTLRGRQAGDGALLWAHVVGGGARVVAAAGPDGEAGWLVAAGEELQVLDPAGAPVWRACAGGEVLGNPLRHDAGVTVFLEGRNRQAWQPPAFIAWATTVAQQRGE